MPTTHHRRLSDMTGLTPLSATTVTPEPQAAYRALQERWGMVAPVELEPGVHAWLVMGHHELCQVMRNEQVFSCDSNNWRLLREGAVAPDAGIGPMMFPRQSAYFADGDQHRRLRAPIEEALASLDEHRLSRLVRTTCIDQIRGFADRGAADLVSEYAAVVSTTVMSSLFGVEDEQRPELRAALVAMYSAAAESVAPAIAVERIVTDTLNFRRMAPGDDLMSGFIRHPNLRSDVEIVQATLLMMAAGYEANANWIAQTLRLMLSDPRFEGRLRGGRLGLDDALDEALWRDPPMPNMPARYALVDCELGGQLVARGDALILGIAAANQDSRVHTDDPWLEDGNRSHLAWSAGPHGCPAHRPGRMIARTAVDVALHQLHDLTLAIPAEELPLLPSPWSRCPPSLPVRFTPPGPAPRG
jgi:cytochrome P450